MTDHAATPQQPHPPTPVPPRNGFGITALCLAIPGLVFGFVPLTGFIALILGALALIFGLLGIARVRKHLATNKVMSWIGTVLGAVAVALGIVGIVIVFQATNQFFDDTNELGRDLGAPPAVPAPAMPEENVVPANPEDDVAPVVPERTAPPVEPYVAPPPTPPPSTYEPPAEPATEAVAVEAFGVGEADVSYYVGLDAGSSHETLPFTFTGEQQQEYGTATISVHRFPDFEAYSNGTAPTGEIGCRITVNGTVVDENSASGEMPYVTCGS